MFYRILTTSVLLLLLLLPAMAQDHNLMDSCVADYDASVDYFPDKVDITNAQNFSVDYHNNYKIVEIIPWQGAEQTFTYVLVQCGTPAPDMEADAVVEVPVNSFVALSTSIFPHLETQGVLDNLVGVDTLLWTNSEALLARSDALTEIGGGGYGEINVELALDLDPDLIMMQQFSAGESTMAVLQDAGLNIVLNSDFADTSPLAQAEWGKYVSLFFNTEASANAAYDTVVSEYSELQALVAEVAERPTVIAATPYAGSWYMPAGDSTVAQLIADAGGNFLFSAEEGTSIVIDFEVVYDQGADAEFWVNVNQFWGTTADALADDARYADFAAFQNGNMWNNNRQMNANGGSAYFETGAANPQWLLADLIAIFHPDLLPDHEFQYYQPLAEAD